MDWTECSECGEECVGDSNDRNFKCPDCGHDDLINELCEKLRQRTNREIGVVGLAAMRVLWGTREDLWSEEIRFVRDMFLAC